MQQGLETWGIAAKSKDEGRKHADSMLGTRFISIYPFGGFHKWGYPEIFLLNGIFRYKPSILGYPHLWKPIFSLPCIWDTAPRVFPKVEAWDPWFEHRSSTTARLLRLTLFGEKLEEPTVFATCAILHPSCHWRPEVQWSCMCFELGWNISGFEEDFDPFWQCFLTTLAPSSI